VTRINVMFGFANTLLQTAYAILESEDENATQLIAHGGLTYMIEPMWTDEGRFEVILTEINGDPMADPDTVPMHGIALLHQEPEDEEDTVRWRRYAMDDDKLSDQGTQIIEALETLLGIVEGVPWKIPA
jgi:hypothetical protein